MSWRVGWYGYDAKSEDHCAWGPEDSPESARQHPSPDVTEYELETMDIRVFHIDDAEPTP